MKKGLFFIFMAAIIAFIFLVSPACEQLSPGRLQANDHFRSANRAYKEEKFRKAKEEYEAALALNPNLTQAYKYLGSSYASLYKPGDESADNKEIGQKALENLKKALEKEPEDMSIITALGQISDKMRNFEEAEKYFLQVLKKNEKDPTIYLIMADFYNNYDKKDMALEMYEKRIALDPENPDVYLFPAGFYFQKKEWDNAELYHQKRLQIIEQSTKLDAKKKKELLADAYYRIGHLNWARSYQTSPDFMGDVERDAVIQKGLENLQKAIDANPNYPDPHVYYGLLWLEKNKTQPEKAAYHQKERDKAIERFQQLNKKRKESEQMVRDLTK